MFLGYNINAAGSRENYSEPSLHLAMEGDYNTGPARFCELHLQYKGIDSTVKRAFGFAVNRATHAISGQFTGSTWAWYKDNGSLWMQFTNGSAISCAPGVTFSRFGGVGPFLMHLNSAGTTYLSLLAFLSGDRIAVGDNNNGGPIVLRTAGNKEIRFDGDMEMLKLASAPSAVPRVARLFVQDDGSGKLRLMVQFPTGPAQQVALQP